MSNTVNDQHRVSDTCFSVHQAIGHESSTTQAMRVKFGKADHAMKFASAGSRKIL